MIRIIPRSISARTVIVLLIGLLISHVISVAIYYGDRVTALTLLGGGHAAERIATITRLVEGTPSIDRPKIIGIVNGPTLQLNWSTAPPMTAGNLLVGGHDCCTRCSGTILSALTKAG